MNNIIIIGHSQQQLTTTKIVDSPGQLPLTTPSTATNVTTHNAALVIILLL